MSVLASASVILTLLVFSDLRKKLFMQIITFISVSDFIGNLPYTTMHRPGNGTWRCGLEGFFNLYFYPVSWMWTTMLAYFLYSLATDGKLPLSKLRIHIICWGLPLVFTLLILTTNPYGREESFGTTTVCTYGGNHVSGFLWHLLTYYGLWVVCVACMGVMYWRIIDIRKNKTAVNLPILKLAMESLQLYPVIMFLCWFARVVSACLQFAGYRYVGDSAFVAFSDVCKILHGLFAACIFFYKSSEARQRWWRLCRCVHVLWLDSESTLPAIDSRASSVATDFSLEYDQQQSSAERTEDLVVNQLHGDDTFVLPTLGGLSSIGGGRPSHRDSMEIEA